jgi:hypothetical protein
MNQRNAGWEAEQRRRKEAWENRDPALNEYKPKKLADTMTMEEIFQSKLPDSLMMSHYAMAETYGYSPQEWRKFLKDNQIFIETELAAITEAEARSALARLGTSTGAEVQALKALLEKSALINNAQKQREKIMLTYLPKQEEQ